MARKTNWGDLQIFNLRVFAPRGHRVHYQVVRRGFNSIQHSNLITKSDSHLWIAWKNCCFQHVEGLRVVWGRCDWVWRFSCEEISVKIWDVLNLNWKLLIMNRIWWKKNLIEFKEKNAKNKLFNSICMHKFHEKKVRTLLKFLFVEINYFIKNGKSKWLDPVWGHSCFSIVSQKFMSKSNFVDWC